MTKPRRYGGKSHPATPTQEQTRPMTTETSNLYVKTAVFDISCKTSLEKTNVASWWPNRADMVENLIPRRQLRSKRDQYRRKLAIYTKIYCFWYLLRKRALSKQNVANWWPNRADMGENLIPRRQLRSKRDQYRRKLAIYTKNTLFLMSPAKTSLEKKKLQADDQTAQVWWKISSRDANSGANETNIDGN